MLVPLRIDAPVPVPPTPPHPHQPPPPTQAGEQLVQSYLALRGSGGGEGKTITATPRQLESLIRLSEALAKVRLSRYGRSVFFGVWMGV